jgi:hypothetical protein
MKANTNNENTSELNRHQRRVLKACTRKNQQFSKHKSLPFGRVTSKGFGFVKVEAMKTSEVGE